MSNIGGYTTRQFSETQKFLVLDPSTQSPSLVSGSSLIEYIQPRLNSVIAESTRVAAQNTDYKVGSIIRTSGDESIADGLGTTFLVVEGGDGDFSMLNGNDLLTIPAPTEDTVIPRSSVVQMVSSTGLVVGDVVRTSGYYTPGDGGGNDYEIVAGGTGTADGGSFIDLDNGLQARGLFNNGENVKQWGGKGIGLSSQAEDTAAIDAYFQYLEDNPGKDGDSINGARNIFLQYDGVVMYFPRGQYYYNGAGYVPLNNKVIVVRGDSPSSSTIFINSDVHLINPDNTSKIMSYVELSDIKIVGGRGAFFNEKTDISQVAHGKRVYNCVFTGYTSVAFGTLQGSDARWVVKNTVFDGSDTGTPVGLLLGSEIAEPEIAGCNTFSGNKYDIITANDGISEMVIGPSNNHFNLSGRAKEADVWIQPGDLNQGKGVRFFGNRHSNENLDVTKPNFLIADRNTGTASHVFDHLTAKSSGQVNGLTLQGLSINSTGNPSTASGATGFIKSYSYKVSGLRWIDNVIGQWRPHILEYDSSITAAEIDEGGAHSNFARLNFSEYNTNAYNPIAFANIEGAGIVTYENRAVGNILGTIDTVSDGNVNFQAIHNTSDPRGWAKGGSVSVVGITDASGGVDAATFTYGADQIVISDLNRANILPGYVAWVEADLKKSASNPLDAIQLEYELHGNRVSYTLNLTDQWQRFRIPLTCASGSHTPSTFTLNFAARLFLDVGVKDSFDIGRFCLYHSQGPVPYSVSGI